MDRKKTYTRNAGRCLIISLLLISVGQSATHKIGTITQAEGEITYLDFAPPHHKLQEVKVDTQFLTDGSYLTQDSSYLTILLFDGSWIRLSPRSKIAAEYDPKNKSLLIHLFSGSIKALFSTQLNDKKLEKMTIKSSSALFETIDAKYTVSRNNITDTTSVFVEKGTVVAVQNVMNERKDMQLIHAKETTSISDRDLDIREPREMSRMEVKFLHPSFYLKQPKAN